MAFENVARWVILYLKNFLQRIQLVMVMAKRLFQRVADEARPPAALGRYGLYENFEQVLLDDLVESGAWLDLKKGRF